MKGKKVKSIVITVAIITVIAITVNTVMKNNSAKASVGSLTSEVEYTVSKGSISMSVSESGNVYPADKRVIKSDINGTIDGIYVTEGDLVDKNQLLISSMSDAANDSRTEINNIKINIERAQRELNNLYENQGDLNIYAPSSGVISDLNIEPEDKINANSLIATIKETDNSYIEVYFTKEQFDNINVGDKASIFMTKYFSTESGSVTEKNSTPVQMGGGIFGYLVTVKMKNPGGYSVGDLTQVTINNTNGSYQGMSNGKIVDVKAKNVTSSISGKIKTVNAENGKYVNKGDVIASIEGDDLAFSISEKKNTISNYQSQLEDLVEGDTIYSPMKGTVLQINVSEDEVVDRNTALMTVADLDNMEVVIAVDELDINKIKLEQSANITCDVYPDENFTGKVSKISLEGKSQNGVTTYDVTIKLDDRKSLMSGMNVDVEILADSKENVIVIPISAVHKLQGQYMVTIKDPSGNKKDVNVELGLATKGKVEITSGLNDGDIIIYNEIPSQNSQSSMEGMMRLHEPDNGGEPRGERP